MPKSGQRPPSSAAAEGAEWRLMAEMSKRTKYWLIAGGTFVAMLLGGFVAMNLWLSSGDAPEEFQASEDLGGTPSGEDEEGPATVDIAGPASGVWMIQIDSASDDGVGYRVIEDLPIGAPEEVVARTDVVSGSATVEGTTISEMSVEVDMASLASDNDFRDGNVADRYLQVGEFGTATFVTTEEIELPLPVQEGELVDFEVDGEMTLHGVTRKVTAAGRAQWTPTVIEVVGSVDVTFDSFGISRPEIFGRSARNEAIVEFKIRFVPEGDVPEGEIPSGEEPATE